ncbi:prolipoprotein diacylglyceryl transferase [Candidatus Poribacteria bacterium]|nr:prolipoprotein diacylglyceryl transferase [Candidatus Poribacteria bacterium]
MHPIILEIGPIHIYSYGLMMAIAFIVTSLLLRKEFERIKINPELAHSITLVAIVCGVIGARAYSVIESWTWSPIFNGILRLLGYILLVAIGFFIFRFLFRRILAEKTETPELMSSLSFTLAVGGAVGVIGYLILTNWKHLSTGFFTSMMGSGLVWYGGLIFASIAVIEVIIRSKNSTQPRPLPRGEFMLRTIDCIGPLLILGYAFGRMG